MSNGVKLGQGAAWSIAFLLGMSCSKERMRPAMSGQAFRVREGTWIGCARPGRMPILRF